MPGVQDFIPWLYMGQNQMNPAVMGQMSGQAEKPEPPVPFLQMPPPQVTPAPQADPMPSTQPSSVPLGATPQEIVPSQPALAAPTQPSMLSADRAMLLASLNQEPTMSPEMERKMRISEKNASEAMLRQDQGIDRLKEQLALYNQAPQGTDYRPLAALVDSLYGGKGQFSKAAERMAPESIQNRLLKSSDLQGKIQQAEAGLTKDQLDFIRQQLQQQSYVENRKNKLDVAKLMGLEKLVQSDTTGGNQQKRLDLMGQRFDLMTEKEARAAVNNDKILNTYTPRLEGAAKIGELIASAKSGKVVNNQALLGQVNAEIARLETGSQSPGLNQSEKTELLDDAAKLHAYVDAVTGKPTDAVRPEVLDAGDKLVKELTGSYKKGIDSRIGVLRAGMRPSQQQIVDQKHKELRDTYSKRIGPWDDLDSMSDEQLKKLLSEQKK